MLLITSHFILWLLQTSCSIFIDVACYNHSHVFYACCTISMHITDILVVMLKSEILLPKNSMCPILPLYKNYLRNYLDPKNYLEAPEWQDDSWGGNCSKTKYRYMYQVPGTSQVLGRPGTGTWYRSGTGNPELKIGRIQHYYLLNCSRMSRNQVFSWLTGNPETVLNFITINLVLSK